MKFCGLVSLLVYPAHCRILLASLLFSAILVCNCGHVRRLRQAKKCFNRAQPAQKSKGLSADNGENHPNSLKLLEAANSRRRDGRRW
jgi:hypothetical protein